MKTCRRCVMDESAGDIKFDENGICNYCRDFTDGNSISNGRYIKDGGSLGSLVEQIKRNGRGKKYDCIVGVSGGIDSSYTLYKACELGLRPLAVHMDNGWNSELAQRNIESLLTYCDCDLFTYVIDWEEYKSLMQAFFNADVIDIELLYDNAMLSVVYSQANRYGLRYILSGSNMSTEGMRMPEGWNWFKFDRKNILSVYKVMGDGKSLNTYPTIGTNQYLLNMLVRKIQWVPFLDYISYEKDAAMQELKEIVGFKPYPGKHYESVFTRFYQGYILPRKFGVDKRRLHLSNLVVTGQTSRSEAVSLLEADPYASEEELSRDTQYVLKKMGWSPNQLAEYIQRKQVGHGSYASEYGYWKEVLRIGKKIKKILALT